MDRDFGGGDEFSADGEDRGAEALLTLLQIFDSQHPIGGFAHSGGLETYAQMDWCVEDLEPLLRSFIVHGWGRLDVAASVLAYRQAEDREAIALLCETLDAWKVIATVRETSHKLGRRLLRLARRLWPDATVSIMVKAPHHAVVVGTLAHRLGLSERPVALAFAQSMLMGQLSAATRCMPLSAERAQEIMIGLRPTVIRAVNRAIAAPEASLCASTPGADIRAHQQALLYTRLFQS